jgi:hypothetical protein
MVALSKINFSERLGDLAEDLGKVSDVEGNFVLPKKTLTNPWERFPRHWDRLPMSKEPLF